MGAGERWRGHEAAGFLWGFSVLGLEPSVLPSLSSLKGSSQQHRDTLLPSVTEANALYYNHIETSLVSIYFCAHHSMFYTPHMQTELLFCCFVCVY